MCGYVHMRASMLRDQKRVLDLPEPDVQGDWKLNLDPPAKL